MRNRLFAEQPDEKLFVDPGKLPEVAKWAAAGFVVLASIVTFLGVQGGVLDRVLRQGAVTSLWIFTLVGGGLLCAVLAPAFSARRWVRLSVPAVVVVLLGLVTWLRLPRIEGDDSVGLPPAAGWAIFAGLVVVALLLSRWHLPVVAAVLTVGIAALSMGLYGATKASVVATASVPTPQVTATLSAEQGGMITVDVFARGRDAPVQLSVYGFGGPDDDADAGALLGMASIRPDDAGEIDDSTTFLLNPAAWQRVSVRTCNPPQCPRSEEALTLTTGQGLFTTTRISGTFSRGKGVAHAAVDGSALPPGCVLTISVYRKTPVLPKVAVFTARLTPDDTGRISWTHDDVPVAASEELQLRYRIAGTEGTGCADAEEMQLASLRP